jgi:hypothetical protein
MEFTVNNLVEIFGPFVMSWLKRIWSGGQGQEEEEEEKPEFELSEEYFEITYRQFIMYMGIQVT